MGLGFQHFNDKGGKEDNTSTTLRLGDDAECKQYRSILSFNTGALPDAAFVSSVKLKVRKQSIVGGGNPVTALAALCSACAKARSALQLWS